MYRDILKKYWGYDSFRSLQQEIIESVGSGRDTLGLMPTGGGKSITFQVPAMAMDGICLVVTPLIALMKDQVANLKARGIKAAAIYAGMTYQSMMETFSNCIYGNYKFLYVSPERLGTRIFLEQLPHLKVCLIAVDESHCISQWGYDFRPSYLKIAEVRHLLPGVPVLALTATATPAVVDDIQEKLEFREKNVFRKSFLRQNLAYIVRKTEDKPQQLLNILKAVPGTSVVYVRNRKKTVEVADALKKAGIAAHHFHAGLTNASKDEIQAGWKSGKYRVIVATNAFGMGIDKADVRTVIHIDIPDSLEAYFQEAGRAGRDEKKAYAVLLYDNEDITKLKKRITDTFPSREKITQVYNALANYFQIAVECGEGGSHDFDIMEFCSTFKFSMMTAHNALKILELAGYIEYKEDDEAYSRVMFLGYRDDLYNTDCSASEEQVINYLLRNYTGLYSNYAIIHEGEIALKTGLTATDVASVLIQLSRRRIINYIPHKVTPVIFYTRDRVPERYLDISREVYEVRKQKFTELIESIIHYATNTTQCRSRMLLSYFGEDNAKDCGVCDVCLARKKNGNIPQGTEDKILTLLSENDSMTIDAITEALKISRDDVVKAVRHLLDNNVILSEAKNLTIKRKNSIEL